MKKVFAWIMIAVMLFGLAACTNQNAPSDSSATTDQTDSESTGQDTSSDDQIVVGFANIAETAYQHTAIKESMEKEAEARGWKLVYMNNNLDGQTAVSNATQMLQMGIDYLMHLDFTGGASSPK